MPEPEEPEIDVPFKGIVVTPPNAIVVIIQDRRGRDLTKVPDGVEVEVTFTARVVRDGQEEEANKHILLAAARMAASLIEEHRGAK